MIKKINENKEISKLAINFSNCVFFLGLLFSILILFYAIYKVFNPYYNITDPIKLNMQLYYLSILFASISTIFFAFGLKKINYYLKINLSLLLLSIIITIYCFEIFLEISSRNLQFNFFNKNIQFDKKDKRSKIEVINDLNDPNFTTNYFPSSFLQAQNLTKQLFKNEKIYPLSGIANSITVFDNESGYFPIVKMDEYGFNNPKGLYIKNMIDIMLVGDSFAESNTVNQNESMAAILRELGFKTITIGKGGNGPLLELATLIEYAKPFQPNLVLWLYYKNDFVNLHDEMNSSFLKNYLYKNDFSQNLILQQDKIDRILKKFIKKVWDVESKIAQINFNRIELENHWAIKISKLYNLRSKLSFVGVPLSPTDKNINIDELQNNFKKILKKSKKTVLDWGGEMYFVYLPAYEHYAYNIEDKNYKFVLDTLKELEIPVIDIHKDLFESFPDPLSLFPPNYYHYNAKGYKLIAETINNRLKDDNFIPLESK